MPETRIRFPSGAGFAFKLNESIRRGKLAKMLETVVDPNGLAA